MNDWFKRGKKIGEEGGYTLYQVHYIDGEAHQIVHEREAKTNIVKKKINNLLHERLAVNGVYDWYAGEGTSEDAYLIWNTKEIPFKVIGRNFASAEERIAEGTPFRTVLLEYKTNEAETPIDATIVVESGLLDFATMEAIEKSAYKINDVARCFWADLGIVLVSFELSFGLDFWGNARLISEFSEKTCTLWNKSGKEVQEAVFGMDLNVEEVANIYEKIK